VTLVIDGRPLRGMAQAATHQAATDEVVDSSNDGPGSTRRSCSAIGRSRRRTLRSIADGTPGRRSDQQSSRPSASPSSGDRREIRARMEELGHAFFVFVNAETEHVAVLYRRRDGDYGLIEPTMGGGYSTNGRRG
jgi:putative sigma-54 modulation protein